MLFIENDNVVEQFPPYRANQTLHETILPWRLIGGLQNLYVHRAQETPHIDAEFAVPIAGRNAYPRLMAVDKDLVARSPTADELTIAEAIALALPELLSEEEALLSAWDGESRSRARSPCTRTPASSRRARACSAARSRSRTAPSRASGGLPGGSGNGMKAAISSPPTAVRSYVPVFLCSTGGSLADLRLVPRRPPVTNAFPGPTPSNEFFTRPRC